MKELLLRHQKKGIPVEKLIPVIGVEVLQVTEADRMVRAVHEERHPLIIRQVVPGLLLHHIVLHQVHQDPGGRIVDRAALVVREADRAVQAVQVVVLVVDQAVLIVEEGSGYFIK